MIKIKSLYKEKGNNLIKDININIGKGESVGIECSNEISDLLINIIINKETKAKGEIYIEGLKNTKLNYEKIGIILREDYFYENMTVEEYMKFFLNIFRTDCDYKEILLKVGLLDIEKSKIKKLNYSQKRRLSFSREILKQPKTLILQDFILHTDDYSKKILIENIKRLKSEGVAVLATSILIKEVLTLGDRVYMIDENGLTDLENDIDTENNTSIGELPVYKIEKITARKEDSILLFDPMEIEYIESENGNCILNINGEKFNSTYTLSGLENKLESFGFFRCHRSYIVNLQIVREVITFTRNSYALNLDNKERSNIPLSKGRLENLRNILNF